MKIGNNVMIYESQKLGEGSYGCVYECSDQHGKKYAVKCIKMNETGIPNILENSVMMTISHPNINTAIQIHTDKKKLYIFQELAKTDLAKHTRKRLRDGSNSLKVIPPNTLRQWSYELAQGIACLHKQNIIHADVKANNVFLFENGKIKLGDFTLAVKVWDEDPHKKLFYHRVCTYSHRPPECWFRKGWSFPLDIWSLGCTLFEIAYGRLLFPSQGKITNKSVKTIVYKKAVNCLLDWSNTGPNAKSTPEWIHAFRMHQNLDYRKATLPSLFTNSEYLKFNQLLLWMLKIDPDQRPTIEDVLKHDYFTGMKTLPYTIITTPIKSLTKKEKERFTEFLDKYAANPLVKRIATGLYCRCTNLKSVSEQMRVATCVWIAEKLLRIHPKDNNLPLELLLESERLVCQHLQFRLHVSSKN
jgi:serine/threonine protein kinase